MELCLRTVCELRETVFSAMLDKTNKYLLSIFIQINNIRNLVSHIASWLLNVYLYTIGLIVILTFNMPFIQIQLTNIYTNTINKHLYKYN